ncbi:MAG: CCA tRNA nucleotidyltransferase [Desulfovibrionaceae bacterium]|nr:CCA tRNA nucleotidyltransferase [Desulfovibrionaceae bacterium]
MNLSSLLLAESNALPSTLQRLFEAVAALSGKLGLRAALVGGFVRDLLLGSAPSIKDIDFLIEGDGIAFARAIAESLGGTVRPHEAFLTATVFFHGTEGSFSADFASARCEHYPEPACLPLVQPATLERDLIRRDVSINAMAIRLDAAAFGQLVDPFGGQKDLADGVLRVLHPASFRDDPTRMFRAARYAARYALRLEEETARLLAAGLNFIPALSGSRLCHECELIAMESSAADAWRMLNAWGVLDAVLPGLAPGQNAHDRHKKLLETLSQTQAGLPDSPDSLLLSLLPLSEHLSPQKAAELGQRLQLPAPRLRAFLTLHAGLPGLRDTLRELHSSLPITPSLCHHALKGWPAEGLLLLASESDGIIQSTLHKELNEWRRQKALVTGADLLAMGFPPGPHIGAMLRTLQDETLNLGITSREQALELARRLCPVR